MSITARQRGELKPAGTRIHHLPGLGSGASLYLASNQSPMSRVSGMGRFTCPVCGIGFETCVFIGRIWQAYGREPIRVRRIQVKSHLCHSARANDASVCQALLDRWGGKGTAIGRKAAPGPLYGVHGDAWAALAVAVTVIDGWRKE